MKRVMMIAPSIYPDIIGGIQLSAYHFARFLRKKRIPLALTINDLTKFDYEELKGFKFFPVPSRSIKGISTWYALFSIFRNLVLFKPDVIVSFGLIDYSLPAVIYANLFRKKCIVRTEGTETIFLGVLDTILKGMICRLADQMICVTPMHFPIVQRFKLKNPPRVLTSGTELPIVDLKKRAGKDYFRILFVGRFDPIKNIDTLLVGFQKLLQNRASLAKDIYLTICSDGPLRQYLENLSVELGIVANVNFPGRVKPEVLNDLYEIADIFVLTSLSEGFPLVIEEALSFGCPIVCSKIPSLSYFLKDSENCIFYYPPNDADQLYLALFSLLNDTPLRKQMEQNNLNYAQKFSWENVGERLWNLILEIGEKK